MLLCELLRREAAEGEQIPVMGRELAHLWRKPVESYSVVGTSSPFAESLSAGLQRAQSSYAGGYRGTAYCSMATAERSP